MNINTNFPNVSLVTTNPATVAVAHENDTKPMIPAATGLLKGAGEEAVAGEREKTLPSGVSVQLSGSYDLLKEAENSATAPRDTAHQEAERAEEGGAREAATDEDTTHGAGSGNHALSKQEQQELKQLKERDAEVVRHEQAHAAVGGQHAGSPSYEYTQGPDGGRYAVAGEVPIDTSEVANDPQATLRKAQQIKAAALAPEQPSDQDRRVAAEADAMAAKAQQEISRQVSAEETPDDEASDTLNRASSGAGEAGLSRINGSEHNGVGAVVDQDTHQGDHQPASRPLAEDPQLQAQLKLRGDRINDFYHGTYANEAQVQLSGQA